MSDTTTNFGFPYPEGMDDADGPAAFQALAERADEVASAGIRSSGKSIIAAEQTTTSTSYTEMGTPDRVEDIVLPTDGLIFIFFQALWKNGISQGGRAALFLGENQLKVHDSDASGAPVVQEATGPVSSAYATLVALGGGLFGATVPAADLTAPVGTGQILGWTTQPTGAGVGPSPGVVVAADAGTYDVSVRFRNTPAVGAAVGVKERKLWVWSQAFGMPPA